MLQKTEEKTDTIFIQIASYRDPELLKTIKDCLMHADAPENLRFGIAWQHCSQDKWDNLNEYINDSRFRIIDIDYKDSEGVCWARHQVQQLYDGEKYTLQLDSHHRFAPHWDTTLISMLKSLQQEGYEKPLITAYIPSFDPDNDPAGRVQTPWKLTFDRFIPEGAIFFLPASFNVAEGDDLSKPMLGRFYSAHFAFTVGQFSVEVQHDPEYYFHGEEISIAVRAWTHGYDIFYPHKIVAWHEYTRKGRTKQWDDNRDWGDRNAKCHLKNRKLFGMDDEPQDVDFGKYGFGTVRSLEDYEKFAGIDFSKRGITEDVLKNRLPKYENIGMDEEIFAASLTTVFKHCIDVGYAQVPLDDYDFWVVAFKDKNGEDMYRQDADADEIARMKNDPDGYCKIWREFKTLKKPSSWIVWPHSKSKDWLDPITGDL